MASPSKKPRVVTTRTGVSREVLDRVASSSGTGHDAAPARNEKGESLDDFMARTAHTKAPDSLRRMAWALDKPIPDVVTAYENAKGAVDA